MEVAVGYIINTMTKSPYYNAAAASLYIIVVGLIMDFGSQVMPKGPRLLAPIAIISLFTLSAAVMGYLFCYTPLVLYFDGKRKAAVNLFLQTVLVFGVITMVALALLFSGFGK